MDITDLQPNTRYEFRVAGYTSKGRGEFSTVGTVMTEPLTPPQPRNCKTDVDQVDGSTAVRVKWRLPENVTVGKYK